MFEEELTRQGSKILDNKESTGDDGKVAGTVRDQDKDRDNSNETLAAGVMGNLLNEVVFILEGDSISVNTTGLHIENSFQQPDTNQIVNPDIENEAKPEVNTTPFIIESPEHEQAVGAVNTETATAKPVETNTAAVENNAATGEVMARMPDIRTQDRQESMEQNSKQSETGSLSPLENENDKTQSVGQKEKTYSEAANAVRNAEENKAEPVTEPVINEIAPPLSEGIKPEQFRAVQQMTEAALNAPVKTENLFQEMISRVETMQNDTKSTMTIQLNPEFLGKVALEVAVDAAGLHVKINAEDSGVRSMINGQLTTLIESLENKGIEVVEVEVIYTGINYGTFQDPREGEQQQNKQQYPTKREISQTDGVAYYTTLPDLMEYYLETGVSSVEYRA